MFLHLLILLFKIGTGSFYPAGIYLSTYPRPMMWDAILRVPDIAVRPSGSRVLRWIAGKRLWS